VIQVGTHKTILGPAVVNFDASTSDLITPPTAAEWAFVKILETAYIKGLSKIFNGCHRIFLSVYSNSNSASPATVF
jgi:hypothetical protein